jgi:hypothetical protein
MILSNGQFLKSTRINAIVRDQTENYQRSLPLRFLDRTPTVNADDEEIMGSFTGSVYAADIIADDQAAVVYEAGAFEFTTNVLPNLKIGQRVSQSKMNMLVRMERGNIDRDEVGIFEGWETNIAANLRRGVDERKNALIAAMNLDLLTYDRFGIKLSVNWGMPSALKVTPSTPWTTAASATPITDVLTMKELAQTTYGEEYNRLTLPMADFRLVTATTEFKNLVVGIVGQPVTSTAYNTLDMRMQGFFSQMIGMQVEFEDKTFTEKSVAGVTSSTRVQPLGKVLLSNSNDDGNPGAMDFGNAIVTESIVAELTGAGNIGGRQYGPIAYWEGSLNPPNVVGWAVTRGFPRKNRKTSTAVLTVR